MTERAEHRVPPQVEAKNPFLKQREVYVSRFKEYIAGAKLGDPRLFAIDDLAADYESGTVREEVDESGEPIFTHPEIGLLYQKLSMDQRLFGVESRIRERTLSMPGYRQARDEVLTLAEDLEISHIERRIAEHEIVEHKINNPDGFREDEWNLTDMMNSNLAEQLSGVVNETIDKPDNREYNYFQF